MGEHFFAGVAQLVEQLIRNQQVSGSSPLAGSTGVRPARPRRLWRERGGGRGLRRPRGLRRRAA